ncbi:diguanylate cyclase [Alteromonas sp. H39]|uniref:sensor domain-containing diguanylate cyclase n=1 Tax=Alteromonas sp. H39 TaxID=3389876 RepID=UPI0039E123C5
MYKPSRLRTQLIAAVLLACLSILATQAFIRYVWILPAFNQMAKQNDYLDIRRVASQFQQEIASLVNLVYDNAVWDQMYQATQQNDVDWFNENYIIGASFQRLGINGWYFYDRNPARIAGSSVDENFSPMKADVFDNASNAYRQGFLFDTREDEDAQLRSNVQFALINEKPALVISHTILRSDESGPYAGTALLWRYINDNFIALLTPGIENDITLSFGDSLTSEHLNYAQEYASIDENTVQAHDGKLVLVVRNHGADPVFTLSIQQRTHPYENSLFDMSLVAGLLISGTILLLFFSYVHFQLLTPIQRLLGNVSQAMRHDDFSGRTNLKGHNELHKLGRRMDELFALISKQRSELVSRNIKLQKLSNTDPLTGLGNRRYLDIQLRNIASHKATRMRSLSMLIVDIDHFKAFNDTYGHARGDQALAQVARTLEQLTHSATDMVARFGGEEFVVILQNTVLEDAVQVANNLRIAIEQLQIPLDTPDFSTYLTISVGVATKPTSETLDITALFDLADRALYEAKNQGRNRVKAADTKPDNAAVKAKPEAQT